MQALTQYNIHDNIPDAPQEKQVISIAPDGSVSGLQRKGQWFDLRTLGKAKIDRVSDILWSEEKQAWFVKFLNLTCGGSVLNLLTYQNYYDAYFGDEPNLKEPSEVLYFKEYEDAVKVEIQVLDYLKMKGGLKRFS